MANASVSIEEANATPATEAHENPAAEDSPKLLTQEQVNTLVGNARVKEREKYPNYEEYKKAFDELNEIRESQKSDLEKANTRAEAAEAKLRDYEHRAEVERWRKEASEKTGVPAEAISGETEEAIQACAESLKKYFPNATKPFVGSDGNAPKATPTGGSGDWLRDAFKGR